MCGIFGILNHSGLPEKALPSASRMADSLSHRGPDQRGCYIDDQILLGQTRLSIIDISHGSQPIPNEDFTKWIIFNGEIFNYPELRSDLLKKGHIFRTHSDTEVILHLYEDKKEGCLEYLNGQFSFAIWDSNKEELFIARDRVGILPFFFAQADNNFIFGSEIKAILNSNLIDREINSSVLNEIFSLWTPIPGNTFFKDVQELKPAHYLLINKNDFIINRYWKLDFSEQVQERNINVEDLIAETHELLKDAIKIRLRADVPVGSYLSGGLDSSGITAFIKNNFNNSLKTFGLTFQEEAFDESSFQKVMADHLGTDHVSYNVQNSEIAKYFPEVIYLTEKPILRTAPVPLYLLSKVVRDNGLKVVLTGEGADEIFGGYNIFKEALIRKFWSKAPDSNIRFLLLNSLYPYIFKDKRLFNSLKTFYKEGINTPDDNYFSHERRWSNTGRIKNFFTNDLNDLITNSDFKQDLLKELPDNFSSWNILSKAQYLEILLFMSGYLLSSQGDRMAMGHSVELRVPYLDHRVIEFMSKIPTTLKIRGLNEKYLLKKVFEKVLPDKIIKRPKNPFRAPIKNSLLNDEFNLAEEYCSENDMIQAGLFEYKKTQLLFTKLKTSSNSSETDNMAAAGIISAQIIYKRYIKSSTVVGTNNNFDKFYDYRKQEQII